MAPVGIRPLEAGDVDGAVDAWVAAIGELRARLHLPGRRPGPADRARIARRIRHLRTTDPGGSWVATRDGRVAGLAQSFVRESYWVLSLLGVDPSVQGSGLGRRLLDRALVHGAGLPGTIQASHDPRAIRLYAAAGFDAHPSLDARGTVRQPVAWPEEVREGSLEDLGTAEKIDRAVRGSARTTDLVHLLGDEGVVLLLDKDRAYAVAREDRIIVLAGLDPAAAGRVLQAAMARAPGAFEVGWLTAGQQWAVRTAVDAGLTLHPRGPVMVRGLEGPPAPYLPSGGLG